MTIEGIASKPERHKRLLFGLRFFLVRHGPHRIGLFFSQISTDG
jgi:hypothetical protein